MAGSNFPDRYTCLMCLTGDPSRHEPGCRDYVQPKPDAAVVPGRPEYQQRVLDELAEVEARYVKLCAFLYGKIPPAISQIDVMLLMQQEAAMHAYKSILAQRIQRF